MNKFPLPLNKCLTVKEFAVTLLLDIVYYEDRMTLLRVPSDHPNARSVGRTYREIWRRITRRFNTYLDPSGKIQKYKTKIGDIRRHAYLIQQGDGDFAGLRLPQRRPRPKHQKRSKNVL